MVSIDQLKPNPNNRNDHPDSQVQQLAKLITYQGWRLPIVVSNQTKYIVAGHGRLLAAKLLNLSEVPVSYQDFDSPEQEYAFGVSDNAIQKQALLDFQAINLDLQDLGPDFDLDLLGIHDFKIDPTDKIDEIKEDQVPEDEQQHLIVVTLKSEQELQKIYEELLERGFECKLMN